VQTLEDMKAKYDRLSNVVSEEADAEKAPMEDVVEKYGTLKEINLMMEKLRTMYIVEQSESRKERQLQSFMQLYKGKMEIEELIKSKLGAASNPSPVSPELAEVEKINAELAQLGAKLSEVEMKVKPGSSTREARFGFA
jgi:triacylglycerol esterase/lipase EstA (alpha/beta hydrolase family)